MNTKGAPGSIDLEIGRIADRQFGLISALQLLALGLSRAGINDRVRTCRLRRIHRGVYAVGHRALRREASWLAAVLACGPGAVLSHRSAAALWQLTGDPARWVDVIVPGRTGRKTRSGIRVHRPRRLDPDEVVSVDGIPVTTVARTLLDLADVLADGPLKRAIDEAERQHLFDLASVTAVVRGNPGRGGARLLNLAAGPPELTRSQLERRFLAFVKRHGLPRPRVGVPFESYTLDFVWQEAGLVAELDGYATHGRRTAFERDRLRDRRVLRAGLRTVRITSRALDDEEELLADLAALLDRR